ncbi:MAG: RHS repeat domain-containing protein [Bacteroides sp.]
MKNLLFVFLLGIPSVLFAQLDRESIERQRMASNHIEQCTQYTHKYTKDKPAPKGYVTSVTTYNRNGNPVLIVNYRANGEESSRLYYVYNDLGQRLEYRKEEPIDKKGKMKVSFKQVFTYDAKGYKKTETGFDGSANYRVVYNYLPNGRLADITRFNADNSVAERWIYSYNGNKQQIRVTPKTGAAYTIEKEFDSNNNLIKDLQIGSDGKEMRKIVYTYDAQKRIETETESYAGEFRHALKYIFNSKGQLVQILKKEGNAGKDMVNNDYAYDSEGNLVTEQWNDGDPTALSKKDSEFDQSGNMVKVDSYYAPYKYRVMYSYQYKKF